MQEIVQLYRDHIISDDPKDVFSVYKWVKNNPDAEINDKCEVRTTYPATGRHRTTLLHLVAMWGPRTLLEAILQHPKCDVNTLDTFRHTAMDKAIIHARHLYVRILCQYGGKLNTSEFVYLLFESNWDMCDELKHTKVMTLLLATNFGTLPVELLILLDSFLILRVELPEFEEATLIDMFL